MILTVPGDICVLGDLNLHWENTTDRTSKHFRDILHSLDLIQHVSEPTHTHHHTLDLIITRSGSNVLSIQEIVNTGLSDHFLILGAFNLGYEYRVKKRICMRPLKRIDIRTYSNDLADKIGQLNISVDRDDVHNIASSFMKLSMDVIDQHAPQRLISVKGNTQKPWYDDEVHASRVVRRRLERRYRKTKLEIDRQMYINQSKEVVKIIKMKKSAYYNNKFSTADSKLTFKLLNNLMHADTDRSLPSNIPKSDLPQTFNDFFVTKVRRIREDLDQPVSAPPLLHASAAQTSSSLAHLLHSNQRTYAR